MPVELTNRVLRMVSRVARFCGGKVTRRVYGRLLRITGFGAGDTIVVPGVDALSWNGVSDMLTLSEGGHPVEALHMLGSWGSGNPFTLNETSAGAVIGLAVPHS